MQSNSFNPPASIDGAGGLGMASAGLLTQRASARNASLPAVGQPPTTGARKNMLGWLPSIVWYAPGDRDSRFPGLDDPSRPYQYRMFKTNPAYFLSKAIRGVTYDELGNVLPLCRVRVYNSQTGALVANAVSDVNGNYSVTVP